MQWLVRVRPGNICGARHIWTTMSKSSRVREHNVSIREENSILPHFIWMRVVFQVESRECLFGLVLDRGTTLDLRVKDCHFGVTQVTRPSACSVSIHMYISCPHSQLSPQPRQSWPIGNKPCHLAINVKHSNGMECVEVAKHTCTQATIWTNVSAFVKQSSAIEDAYYYACGESCTPEKKRKSFLIWNNALISM